MTRVREAAFQLERFEWVERRLEVAGRWEGLTGRRRGRPVLTVTAGPRRRRLVAMPDPREVERDAVEWLAAFAWEGDPDSITRAELEVARNVVVDLPLPDRRKRRRRPPSGADAPPRPKDELGALRAELERLRGALGSESTADSALVAERDRALAELRRSNGEIDDLRQAFADAAEEAETQRAALRHAQDALAAAGRTEAGQGEIERLTQALAERDAALTAARAEVARLRSAPGTQPAGPVPAAAADAAEGSATPTRTRGSAAGRDRDRQRERSAAATVTRTRPRAPARPNGAGPGPRRSATRRRAGETAAAHGTTQEQWALRLVAAVVVAALLILLVTIVVLVA